MLSTWLTIACLHDSTFILCEPIFKSKRKHHVFEDLGIPIKVIGGASNPTLPPHFRGHYTFVKYFTNYASINESLKYGFSMIFCCMCLKTRPIDVFDLSYLSMLLFQCNAKAALE